jgi:hypothetical protein
MTVALACFTAADRAISSASVELCVGTMVCPAKYMWSSLSTWTQRTGAEST